MKTRLLALVLLVVMAAPLLAQPHLIVPQASPKARVEETFGITGVAVDYHRPAVNGRRIANESTLVTFSTRVTVEGQPLAAGTYSLYLIPAQSQWKAVFNRFTGGWGAYSYDEKEDVLRVNVTSEPADMQERLAYVFEEPKDDSVTLALRWEKLRVPIHLRADTTNLVAASIENQLRSDLHWVSQAWTEAARFALRQNDLGSAERYIDRSIAMSADAFNLRTKANILDKKGDNKTARELRDRAALLSPEITFASGTYQLIGQKKYDDATKMVNAYLATNPNSWRAHALLGAIYSEQGDAAKAKASFDKALALATTYSDKVEVYDTINSLEAERK
jgi:tetratricopeptide (TPR) repeat protein